MSMCARVLFGIGGCLGLLSSILLIIAVASPMFASLSTTNTLFESETDRLWGLSKGGAGCGNQKCKDLNKAAFPKAEDFEKACEKTANEDKTGSTCTADTSNYFCWCTYGDKDKQLKIWKDNPKHAKICDPNAPVNSARAGCDKFDYDSPEDVFDATWGARTMTMMMLIIAIIFGFLMTITAYASAAILHPIAGWVAVCLTAMTMLFSIIGLMTGMKFGFLAITGGSCGSWSCYETTASRDGKGDKLVATFYLSQILILVSAIQCYIALCLILIGAFVARKGAAEGK